MLDWLSTLNAKQRAVLADKVFDTANVAIGALVFGQAIASRWSPFLMLSGIALWLLFYWFGLQLLRENHDVL